MLLAPAMQGSATDICNTDRRKGRHAMEDLPTDQIPWLAKDRSDWDESVRQWLEEVAQTKSLGKIVSVMEVKARPWSMISRVIFERSTAYFKACGSGGRHESDLLAFLARTWPEQVPSLLDRDDVRSWILMADGGGSLRDEIDANLQISLLKRILPLYGEMQRASIGSVKELIRLGLPDRRLGRLPELLEHLAAGDAFEFGRSPQDANRLRTAVRTSLPSLTRVCATLASSAYALALDHGDLHIGNVLVDKNRLRLCDWGDACLTHPFCSIGVTIESTLPSVPEADRGRIEAQLLAAYMEPWTALASPATLQSEMQMALWVMQVLRALDFAHMFAEEDGEQSCQRWKPLIGERLYRWISLPIPAS